MADPVVMRARAHSLPIVKQPIEEAVITQQIEPLEHAISEMQTGRGIYLTSLVGAIAFFALVFLY